MKLTLLVSFFLGLMSACSIDDQPEQKPLWYSYGTYKTDNSDFIFTILLDNGQELKPINDNDFGLALEDMTRVFLSFSIDSQTEEEIHGTIDEIGKIATMGITQLTDEIEDSIGYDGIVLNSSGVWLSKYHLNVSFSYYGGGVSHNINLVKPIGEQTDSVGNQILELRHNANGDTYAQSIEGLVAFNMDSLYVEGLDSLPFVLRAYDYDSTLTEMTGTHHFNEGNLLRKKLTNIEIEHDYLIE